MGSTATLYLARLQTILARTRNAIIRSDKLLGNFSAPDDQGGPNDKERERAGFAIVVPKPEAVLPALEVALELMKIVTGNKKQRKPELAAHDVIAVVRSAYSALTGYRGGRAILPSGEPSRSVRLGHDIDRLFGTKIFPKVDSTRLKKKPADKKPLRRAK
jgi:hypothetical protein